MRIHSGFFQYEDMATYPRHCHWGNGEHMELQPYRLSVNGEDPRGCNG